MTLSRAKQKLLCELEGLVAEVRSKDEKMLERVAKCPSAIRASDVLARAIEESVHVPDHTSLAPRASWVHPII
jgi:hypothetical protein